MNTTTESPSSSSKQEIFERFRPQITGEISVGGSHENHRKKRSKLNRIEESKHSNDFLKPKNSGKKPGPNAPKITRPCSECGKKFWSWKALFGHMRCHPERQWRGINPPAQFQRNPRQGHEEIFTEEDHEAAACLIMLANGLSPPDTPYFTIDRGLLGSSDYIAESSWAAENVDGIGPSELNYRFECSSCKKVFGSRQALGGHRASHKNIKGCFAITKNDDGHNGGEEEDHMDMVLRHRCNICLRVFSSGQALGGHMRCHWEKGEEPSQQGLNPSTRRDGCVLDLNLPASTETDGDSSTSSSSLALDLRLGI